MEKKIKENLLWLEHHRTNLSSFVLRTVLSHRLSLRLIAQVNEGKVADVEQQRRQDQPA